MAYGNGYAPYGVNGYGSGYAPSMPAYGTPRMDFPQMQQQVQAQQPGNVFARIVTGREEAIAAQVLPDGNFNAFLDIAHGRVYLKRFNPQTGGADFREMVDVQQVSGSAQQPEVPVQYVTVDAFKRLENQVGRLEDQLSALAPKGGDLSE